MPIGSHVSVENEMAPTADDATELPFSHAAGLRASLTRISGSIAGDASVVF
jgi:hypothetical protein